MKKILMVFGTRPEAIKMAPLFHILKDHFDVKVCVTGQHREMLDQVLSIFEIVPDYDLNVMRPDQTLSTVTTQIISDIEKVIKDFSPHLILVHGDTTTAMATSLASFYLDIDVGHVEAGLRTHDIKSPFPEELNRQIISRIARFHFVPTEISRKNLLDENIADENITITGNTVIDAMFSMIESARKYSFTSNILKTLTMSSKLKNKIILVTGHRRENFGTGFKNICTALSEIAKENPKSNIVYPVHLNPNVLEPVHEILGDYENIHLIEPLNYLEFLKLMDMSYLILTDSGGIQEEAPSLGKPVLVMRETTERPEAHKAGTVELVGTDIKRITDKVSALIKNEEYYSRMSKAQNPYGDGTASLKIKEFLEERL